MKQQDTNSGRGDIRGFPYWHTSNDDDLRTIKIKAAKNIISLITQWRKVGTDASGNICGPKQMDLYHKAIELLKQEGEKYP